MENTEKTVSFGQGAKWQDVKADDATFDKSFSPSGADENKPMEWEQWAGIVKRGKRESLVLV